MKTSYFFDIDQTFRKESIQFEAKIRSHHTRRNFGLLAAWCFGLILSISQENSTSEPGIAMILLVFLSIILFAYFVISKLLHEIHMSNFSLKIHEILKNIHQISIISEKKDERNMNDIVQELNGIDTIINILRDISRKRLLSNFPHTVAHIGSIIIELQDTIRGQIQTYIARIQAAQSELDQHLSGTPELLAVSNIQSTRLSRQIEQFEELQKVLVKV